MSNKLVPPKSTQSAITQSDNPFSGQGQTIENSKIKQSIKKFFERVKRRIDEKNKQELDELMYISPFERNSIIDELIEKVKYQEERLKQIENDVKNSGGHGEQTSADSTEEKVRQLSQRIEEKIKEHCEKIKKVEAKKGITVGKDEVQEYHEQKAGLEAAEGALEKLDGGLQAKRAELARLQQRYRLNRQALALINQIDQTPFYILQDYTSSFYHITQGRQSSRLIFRSKDVIARAVNDLQKQLFTLECQETGSQAKEQSEKIKQRFLIAKNTALEYLNTDFPFDVLAKWAQRQQKSAEAGHLSASPYYDQKRMAAGATKERVQKALQQHDIFQPLNNNTKDSQNDKKNSQNQLFQASLRYVYFLYDEEIEIALKNDFFAWLNTHHQNVLKDLIIDQKRREAIQYRKSLYSSDNNDPLAIWYLYLQLSIQDRIQEDLKNK